MGFPKKNAWETINFICLALWLPSTLNDYLTTYILDKPHNNTEAALSPAMAATGLLKSCCF